MYAANYSRAPTVGADLSCPNITEYTLRIVHVHQRLPTCTHCRGRFIVPEYYGVHGVDNRVHLCLSSYTHCDTWLHLYNSIWTGAMNRPLRLRNVCYDCPRITTFNPRTRCYTLFGTLYISFFLKIICWIKIIFLCM